MFKNMSHATGVRKAIKECLGVKSEEEVLIVGDTDKLDIVHTFATIASGLASEVIVSLMKPRNNHGEEPPEPIAQAMKNADVVLILTTKSLTHTIARERACDMGARIASMPGITKEILKNVMIVNYDEINHRTELLAEKLKASSEAKLSTEKGTNLHLDLSSRDGLTDTGILKKKGDFGNLPAGEAYCAPVEGKGKGRIVIDISMSEIGMLSEPIDIKVKKGKILSIEGGSEAERFKECLRCVNDNSSKLAELGIGTNDNAKPMGHALVDEKILGTTHIAFGDNSHIGGEQRSKVHLDGVISEPTLILDGNPILEKGELLINQD